MKLPGQCIISKVKQRFRRPFDMFTLCLSKEKNMFPSLQFAMMFSMFFSGQGTLLNLFQNISFSMQQPQSVILASLITSNSLQCFLSGTIWKTIYLLSSICCVFAKALLTHNLLSNMAIITMKRGCNRLLVKTVLFLQLFSYFFYFSFPVFFIPYIFSNTFTKFCSSFLLLLIFPIFSFVSGFKKFRRDWI